MVANRGQRPIGEDSARVSASNSGWAGLDVSLVTKPGSSGPGTSLPASRRSTFRAGSSDKRAARGLAVGTSVWGEASPVYACGLDPFDQQSAASIQLSAGRAPICEAQESGIRGILI